MKRSLKEPASKKKEKLKIGVVIIGYTLLVTIAFLTGILMFQQQLQRKDALLNDAYHAHMVRSLIPLAIFFCLFLLVTSVAFWFILKRIQTQNTRRIAGKLWRIAEEETIWDTEGDLETAYDSLQKNM